MYVGMIETRSLKILLKSFHDNYSGLFKETTLYVALYILAIFQLWYDELFTRYKDDKEKVCKWGPPPPAIMLSNKFFGLGGSLPFKPGVSKVFARRATCGKMNICGAALDYNTGSRPYSIHFMNQATWASQNLIKGRI